jgi:hypothetical protein
VRQDKQKEIEQLFKDGNCELLDTYTYAKTPLKYRCSCGKISKITVGNFRNGSRCRECGGKKISLKNKGRKDSNETRMKKSNSHKGLKAPFMLGNTFGEFNKGRIVSMETKIKKSMSHQGIDNHEDWNGFITPENLKIRNSPEYAQWRTEVFKRDNYTCQDCGQVGGKLNAHHLMSFAEYPKYRFVVEFGHTLCKKCHKELHQRLRSYRKVV